MGWMSIVWTVDFKKWKIGPTTAVFIKIIIFKVHCSHHWHSPWFLGQNRSTSLVWAYGTLKHILSRQAWAPHTLLDDFGAYFWLLHRKKSCKSLDRLVKNHDKHYFKVSWAHTRLASSLTKARVPTRLQRYKRLLFSLFWPQNIDYVYTYMYYI